MEDINMKSGKYSKPFVKKFTHHDLFYVYDVNTNQVVEVEKPIFDIIDKFEDGGFTQLEEKYKDVYPASQLQKSIDEIRDAQETHGLFSTSRPKAVMLGVRKSETVKRLHNDGLQQLLLELTGNCNLNCHYCDVSGKYGDKSIHQRNMSMETCIKAIDFFCRKTAGFESPVISFYGGEPLLRFDLIKNAVRHIKKNYNFEKYSYSMTSNGTIMNEEIYDFLIKNDFNIMISLDGPEHIHDRYRVPVNGGSAFKQVIDNLEFMQRYNSEFFSGKVRINCVLAPPFHLDETLDFFNSHETVSQLKVRGSIVDNRETTFLEDFNLEESAREFKTVHKQLVERLKKNILEQNFEKISIERMTVLSIVVNLARRGFTKLHEYMVPFGTCHIGLRRLFVKSNGDFHLCERAGNHYPIGDLDNGFDYEKIADYYRKLDEVLHICKNCWAMIHCERCWANIGNPEEFKDENQDSFCSFQKKSVEIALKAYVELLQKDPDCLKILQEVETR